MGGCKIFLVIIFIFCYVHNGSSTGENNNCYPDIPCDDGECITRAQWCDKTTNCPDGSDERYCKTGGFFFSPNHKCDENLHFTCRNEKCVPRVLACDGFDDCEDNSDEESCLEVSSETDSATPSTETSYPTSTEPSTSLLDRINTHIRPTPDFVDHYQTRMEEVRNQRRYTAGENHTPTNHRDNRRSNGHHTSGYDTSQTNNEHHSRYNAQHSSGSHTPQTTYNGHHTAGALPTIREDSRRYDGHHTSGSDTVPTGYYQQHWHTYPHPQEVPYPFQVSQIPVTGTRYIPSVTHAISSDRYHWPVIHQPRVVFHSQPQSRTPPRSKTPRPQPLPPFHFEVDRTKKLSRRYSRAIHRAEEWLMDQIDTSQGRGKDVPRALVALSLVTNGFPHNSSKHDILRRKLKLDLGGKLLRSKDQPMTDYDLALYITALLATCQDPRQVFEQNLVEMLTHTILQQSRQGIQSSPFALLALCLSRDSAPDEYLGMLYGIVDSAITDEVSKDRFILAVSALSCMHKSGSQDNELGLRLADASRKLLDLQNNDGSYGTKYSSALAAQALFAIDSTVWREDKTLDFLSGHQENDGSFGDLLATYYILPALNGRSLLHLRNTSCERQEDKTSTEDTDVVIEGPTKNILYSLAVGQEQRNSIALHMTVPAGASFFEIMQMAQRRDSRFRFKHAEFHRKLDVYSISDVPNDPERGTYWNLYVLDSRNRTLDTTQVYVGDIRSLIPADSQELLYWYLPFKVNFP